MGEGWKYERKPTDCGNGGDDFTELQFVQDGCFTGRIESDHENSHLFLSPYSVKELGNADTHFGVGAGQGGGGGFLPF